MEQPPPAYDGPPIPAAVPWVPLAGQPLPLPPGFEFRLIPTPHFVDHIHRTTSYYDPRPLPQGFTQALTPDNVLYFMDHAHQATHWVHPCGAPLPLPPGVEVTVPSDGTRPFFTDHNIRATYFDLPLHLAVAPMVPSDAMPPAGSAAGNPTPLPPQQMPPPQQQPQQPQPQQQQPQPPQPQQLPAQGAHALGMHAQGLPPMALAPGAAMFQKDAQGCWYQGYMFKRGGTFNTDFQKRYFRVRDDRIDYYIANASETPRGNIPLKGASVDHRPAAGAMTNELRIKCPAMNNRVFHIRGNSDVIDKLVAPQVAWLVQQPWNK